MTIGATWSKQHAAAAGAIVGRELAAAGINMLLGPVVDVLDNPRSGGTGESASAVRRQPGVGRDRSRVRARRTEAAGACCPWPSTSPATAAATADGQRGAHRQQVARPAPLVN
jgi:hypothetical protein